MHFNGLNYLLILFVLVIKVTNNSNILRRVPSSYVLNEVSDFNDILERGCQSPLNEENQLPQSDSANVREVKLQEYPHPDETFEDGVFSSSVLSDCDSNEDAICPKQDNKHRDSVAITEKLSSPLAQDEEVIKPDQKKLKMVRLLPRKCVHIGFESTETAVIIKENILPSYAIVKNPPSPWGMEITRPLDKSNNNVPDYVYDFDNVKADESGENCKKINGILPIPLLESILINKLLETRETSKPYPFKHVVQSVLPNLENIEALDNPIIQECVKSYLQRRKRQLDYLKKRSAKHKKASAKKGKKPKKGDRHKMHRRLRSTNDSLENQLNAIVAYVDRNQTFNDTLTFMPLLFGTVSPADGQVLLAGIKHNASAEEKVMLQGILSIKSQEISTNPVTATIEQTTQDIKLSVQQTNLTTLGNQATQENVNYNFNLNLSSPEVKKAFIEIMQRQHNFGNYEVNTSINYKVFPRSRKERSRIERYCTLNKDKQ